MFTDSQKNLWIGSVDQGYVVRYNYKERFNTNNHLSSYLNRKSVLSVAVDKERNLWMATMMIDGLYVYNMDSHEVKSGLGWTSGKKRYRQTGHHTRIRR